MTEGHNAAAEQSEHGIDRCIRTVFAAVIALRDCGENDEDITKALRAILDYGPREALNRISEPEREAMAVVKPAVSQGNGD